MQDFGVVICTCKFDFFLAKGCVASVRASLGNVPITLFIDDDLDAMGFARHFGVNVMYRREVRDPWLRSFNTGWGLPKMTLLWESPYEHFLYLDCDTIVWGDVGKAYLKPFDAGMIIDPGDFVSRPWMPGVGTDAQIKRDYFDPSVMEGVFPEFPWKKYRHKFFCTGVFAATRNCLSLSEYKRIIEARDSNPGLFPNGEMPLLNLLIFLAEERGELNVQRAPIQLVCDWENQEYLKQEFQIGDTGPNLSHPAPTVLHFTDPKPLACSSGFNSPMQFFREKCARDYLGIPACLAKFFTRIEEMKWRLRVAYRRKYGGLHSRARRTIRHLLNHKSK